MAPESDLSWPAAAVAIVRIAVQGAVCVYLAALGLIPGEAAAVAAGVPALLGWLRMEQMTRRARSQERSREPPVLPPTSGG